jgi:hypothetical protein
MTIKILVTGYYDQSGYKTFLPTMMSPDKPKYPDYIKKVLNLLSATGEPKIYALYEVPDDKIYDALKHLNKRYFFYAANLPGYEYVIDIVAPIEDAMETMK